MVQVLGLVPSGWEFESRFEQSASPRSLSVGVVESVSSPLKEKKTEVLRAAGLRTLQIPRQREKVVLEKLCRNPTDIRTN